MTLLAWAKNHIPDAVQETLVSNNDLPQQRMSASKRYQ